METIMKKTVLPLLLVLLVIAGGCRSKKGISIDPSEKGSDKKMYENAMKYMGKDPEKSRLLFKEVAQLYPDSIYANKAKLGIGDSYFREHDSASLVMAAAEYQEYVNLYPYSPDAVYAKYQIGHVLLPAGQEAGTRPDQHVHGHQVIRRGDSAVSRHSRSRRGEKEN